MCVIVKATEPAKKDKVESCLSRVQRNREEEEKEIYFVLIKKWHLF